MILENKKPSRLFRVYVQPWIDYDDPNTTLSAYFSKAGYLELNLRLDLLETEEVFEV